MATTYSSSTVPVLSTGDADGVAVGLSTDAVGFYGDVGTTIQSLTQLATTATTTQLRAELSALQNALAAVNLVDVT